MKIHDITPLDSFITHYNRARYNEPYDIANRIPVDSGPSVTNHARKFPQSGTMELRLTSKSVTHTFFMHPFEDKEATFYPSHRSLSEKSGDAMIGLCSMSSTCPKAQSCAPLLRFNVRRGERQKCSSVVKTRCQHQQSSGIRLDN